MKFVNIQAVKLTSVFLFLFFFLIEVTFKLASFLYFFALEVFMLAIYTYNFIGKEKLFDLYNAKIIKPVFP